MHASKTGVHVYIWESFSGDEDKRKRGQVVIEWKRSVLLRFFEV